jgi:DNA (cytosine-5)-methyltransferase 1
MKILELFSGMGTTTFALKRLGIDYELIGYSDIDKFANQCFKQNHCPNDTEDKLRLGDITKIDINSLPDFDLLTGGTPCQDFSVAGKGKGLFNEDGTPTRSGLLFEYVKILEAKKPKYFMWENVKGVITQKHKEAFIMFLEKLCSIGYEIDFKLLNTKDYGIPQNRERVFVVGRRIC